MRITRARIGVAFLSVIAVSLVLVRLPAGAQTYLSSEIELTSPSGLLSFGEAREYASLEWGDPWDMSDTLDIRQLDSPQCVWPNHFTEYIPCEKGVWCGQVRSDVRNPDLFLLHPGYEGAMAVGRMGSLHPIDAEHYTRLTFRMYVGSVEAGEPGWQLVWTDGTVADIGKDSDRYGSSHLFKMYPGWNIYTIDLSIYEDAAPSDAPGSLPWAGQLTGLRLDPGLASMNDKVVKLDWVRLTSPRSRRIEWRMHGGEESIDIMLQSDGETDVLRMYQVRSSGATEWTEPLSIPASRGYYDVPASLPSGDWYVQLRAGGELSNAAGPWRIRQIPMMHFIEPGYTSGEGYARTELGNPWDLATSEDVYSYSGITAPRFSDGVLSATSLDQDTKNDCSGGWENPYLNLLDDEYWDGDADPPIDVTKYRYLTFRLRLDGVPDISYGWIARVVWSNFEFKNCGITNDIPLHQGWNEVSLDLWDKRIIDDEDPCQSPWQADPRRRQIRLDPLETPESTAFQIDNVRLTAPDSAAQGSIFIIRYELEGSEDTDATFYYDKDTNPDNGRTPARERVSSPASVAGAESVYLPLIVNQSWNSLGGSTFSWDLTDVEPGTYYVSATLDDGYSETTWYSETPVVVTSP